ncbi:hypothetical protein [Geomonas azotofigens]|uniref:hypothetical protein n=1 Tax=Geomonas azotofigens TaxID=2843196 RepID=UPI001C1047AB|nr:hypothetical protein [Geomonas azotofigens]MBU5614716.1 hypothetical protein [Geomonas azotofigens]
MKTKIRYLVVFVVLSSLLPGCIIVPVDGYYGHHHGYYYDDYDRHYDRGPYGWRR